MGVFGVTRLIFSNWSHVGHVVTRREKGLGMHKMLLLCKNGDVTLVVKAMSQLMSNNSA